MYEAQYSIFRNSPNLNKEMFWIKHSVVLSEQTNKTINLQSQLFQTTLYFSVYNVLHVSASFIKSSSGSSVILIPIPGEWIKKKAKTCRKHVLDNTIQ
jgi:hypothetical protein